ncbi:hypothetical protein ARMGADRAFT_933665, partial [Armillaria gallica]
LQLGYSIGKTCPSSMPAYKDFMVLYLNGIHIVLVDFCECLPTVEYPVVAASCQPLILFLYLIYHEQEALLCSIPIKDL